MGMEVTLEGGVHVDIATRDDVEEIHRRHRPKPHRAGYRALSNGAQAGTGPLLIDFGEPPAGKLYVAQWLTIFPDTPFLGASNATVANVSAALFAGIPRGQSGAGLVYSIGDVIQGGLLVPSNTNLPDDAIAHGGQHLYVVLAGSGLAAGTSVGYNANCGVLIADDDPETIAWV